MSFSTFSGPVRSGTVRTGSAVNTGLIVMEQNIAILPPQGTTTTSGTLVIPAGARILTMYADTATTFTSGCAVTATGNDSATPIADAMLITGGATTGRYWFDIGATGPANVARWNNLSVTDDITITFTTTGAATVGAATCVIIYVQRAVAGGVAIISPVTP